MFESLPSSINPFRRPAVISTQRACLLSLTFPTSGPISASTSLGIVWANPANHAELLSPLKGFDFAQGFGYFLLNTVSVTSQTLLPSAALQFFIVDSTGSDLYPCGGSNPNINAGVFSYDVASFGISAGATPGSGIRAQLTISGTYTIVVPTTLLFFGSMGST